MVEPSNDKQGVEEAWHEVGQQFQTLGESLAMALRAAWDNEENRQHLESMKTGLEVMVDKVGLAIEETSTSPQAQQVRQEVKKAAKSARAAGEKALQDARPHLVSALNQVNAEVQRFVSRLEGRDPETEA